MSNGAVFFVACSMVHCCIRRLLVPPVSTSWLRSTSSCIRYTPHPALLSPAPPPCPGCAPPLSPFSRTPHPALAIPAPPDPMPSHAHGRAHHTHSYPSTREKRTKKHGSKAYSGRVCRRHCRTGRIPRAARTALSCSGGRVCELIPSGCGVELAACLDRTCASVGHAGACAAVWPGPPDGVTTHQVPRVRGSSVCGPA